MNQIFEEVSPQATGAGKSQPTQARSDVINNEINTATAELVHSGDFRAKNKQQLTSQDRIYNLLPVSPGNFEMKNVNIQKQENNFVVINMYKCDRCKHETSLHHHSPNPTNDCVTHDDAVNENESRGSEVRKRSRRKQLCKVLCWTGWIMCCPIWTLGLCLRENPHSDDDDEYLSDDPCWPCYYDTTVRARY